ncbi:hypothetical protein [Streptomyces sp. NPDC088775]|uniref:hypothetical protein n=1 Tax=Streptomyces sp. NPDC088775 TaxID=3365896 RepID=UPI00381FDBAC
MSGQGWERRHAAEYGTTAWSRAVVSCGALVAHHAGYDRRPGAVSEAAAGFRQEWMPVAELLALAACRAGQAQDRPVDDVELPVLLGWADGAHTHLLHTGPLDGHLGPAHWLRLAEDETCRSRARDVVTTESTLAIVESRELTGGRTSTPARALRLGARAAAAQARGVGFPAWADDCAWAADQVERLHLAMQAGAWRPTSAHRAYAREVHRTLVAEPDHPPCPAGAVGPSWIQRVVRIPHVRATVLALAAQPAYAVAAPASDPLGAAVDAVVHVGMEPVSVLAAGLERAWAAQLPDRPVAEWELAHIPGPVREQIRAVEALALRLTVVLLDLWHPHE